jgi:hypothetical protein
MCTSALSKKFSLKMLSEAPVRSDILSHFENIKRDRDRPRLTWEKIIKRYLNE